ncbi:hypothetical protein [Hydrogenophaga pseudoflava]|uniref:hypothetical protein n=1 Tax=Hydrogenophaga pseudoflava TaxID=47421 RepID=UPI0027E56DD6|nr:hypothetical protein [Hydrogenophaga pseudoflava]MDQ7745542.1 hypothetical protein [Hydrogenophaga pseudoflava]
MAASSVILLSAALYFLLSLKFAGPAYLQDEIGYLAKAAFLAGKSIDAASSYHAGYSVLLAPLFLLTTEVSQVWTGVVALNAAMWVASLFMIQRLIPVIYPSVRPSAMLASVAGTATYPAWPTLTGYAFPSPLVVASILLCLLLLNELKERSWRAPETLAVCAGITFWIHPTGLAIIGALTATLAMACPKTERTGLLLKFLLITSALVVTYKAGIHPWINQAMTPDGFQPTTHYKTYTEVLRKLLDPAVIGRSLLRLMGELSYLTISTLGVFVIGSWLLIQKLRAGLSSQAAVLSLCSLLTLSGIALMAALQLETYETANDIQHWQYGRYIDTALPLVLSIGFAHLAQHLKRPNAFLGFFLILPFLAATGLLLDQWSNAIPVNNIFATPAFWPQYLVETSSFFQWYLMGCAACAVALSAPRFTMPAAWALATTLSISAQYEWHQGILQGYSRPTALPDIIKDNHAAGSCVAFEKPAALEVPTLQDERLNLYAIHLANMVFVRMQPEQWLKECDGPFLTYRPDSFKGNQNAIPMVREMDSGLYLIEKREHLNHAPYHLPEEPSSLTVNRSKEKDYLSRTLLHRASKDLSRHTQVGVPGSRGLASTGNTGYLFFGPYMELSKGQYRLEIRATAPKTDTVVVDVVNARAGRKYLQAQICKEGCSADAPVLLDLTIPDNESSLEVRMHVQRSDTVLVQSVQLTTLEDHQRKAP